MIKIKESFASISYFLVIIVLFLLFVQGCNHGEKKHNSESTNFFINWYYGAESFWHKTDITELNDNVKVAIYLLMKNTESTNPKEQLEFNKSRNEFKKVLKNYDTEEVNYIKKGAKTYLEFKDDFEKQCYDALAVFEQTKIFNLEQTKKSIRLTKELSRFGLEKEMKEYTVVIKNLSRQMEENLEENPNYIEELLQKKEILADNLQDGIVARKKIFDDLFE